MKLSIYRLMLFISGTTYNIISHSGAKVKALLNDTLGTSEEPTDTLSELFMANRPCLAGSLIPDCVSLMTLRKSGWFLRHFGEDRLLLQPKTNPRNSTTFASDASFLVREGRFFANYVALESVNLPGYFVSMQSDANGPLTLQRIRNDSSFYEAASFRLVSPTSISNRRKRDTSGKFIQVHYIFNYKKKLHNASNDVPNSIMHHISTSF